MTTTLTKRKVRKNATARKTGKPGKVRKPTATSAKQGPKKAPPAPAVPDRRYSALDAAAKVLKEEKKALDARTLVNRISQRGLWKPPQGGKTPHATLAAAISREIDAKGQAARFNRVSRGLFGFNRRQVDSAAKVEQHLSVKNLLRLLTAALAKQPA